MDRKLDPRTIVTPYAFAVHPDLLGMPLASPWQRFGAISIDLVVIGFLSLVGLGPLAIAFTALLFWLATRAPNRDTVGKFFRIAVGCLGLTILGITGLVLFVLNNQQVQTAIDEVRTQIEAASEGTPPGGAPASAIDEAGDPDPGDAGQVVAGAMATLPSAVQEAAPAQTPGDSTGEGEESPFSAAAAETIENLNGELVQARENLDDVQEALDRTNELLEAERNQGPFDWILGLIDDIGIGSLWGALYLTITHAWWKGRSIGKKLFGIRVVMIDKRPLNWWLSFERTGGYAAGFATGLLGFAQVFWDPNRQAIHDKVSETIVIREGMAPIPGPWIQEGKAQWTRGQHGPDEVKLKK